jgi:glycosyltransferase involved in cell wall biosynthesis
MAKATLGAVREIASTRGPINVIDAHYFYPDGVAAAQVAERLGIPFVVTARGSDINVIAEFAKPRQMIVEAAHRAKMVIAVSEALKRSLVGLGVDEGKIEVLRNGVDLTFFCPGDRVALRDKLGFDSTMFISVGALKEAKGHDVAIRSLAHIPGASLTVIGGGPFENELKSLATSLGLESRVDFAGRLSADELLDYYQAADALLLVSRREGMPNVVLESLACGTPVIAADVGGIREVVSDPAMGELLSDRRPQSLATAWRSLMQRGIDRGTIRKRAECLSWEPTIEGLHSVFERCASVSQP